MSAMMLAAMARYGECRFFQKSILANADMVDNAGDTLSMHKSLINYLREMVRLTGPQTCQPDPWAMQPL